MMTLDHNLKILLKERESTSSVNEHTLLPIEIDSTSKIVPSLSVGLTFDAYQQYVKEHDESNKFRIICTIKPYCTNVLFNSVSEIVYNEGSDDCVVFNNDGPSSKLKGTNIEKYNEDLGRQETHMTRYNLIRDTAYSHPNIGPVVYHCGYDIFNNHTLRRNDFNVINKIESNIEEEKKINFNTLEDYQRDFNGEIVTHFGYTNEETAEKNETEKLLTHAYQYDTIKTFSESINDNLIEDNGWVGFMNKSNVGIENYNDLSFDKTMNNNKPNEQYDMYPDRSLFSFIPKINKYRKRLEPNWDYCLTYPYRNDYTNENIQYNSDTLKINGLKTVIASTDYEFQEDGSILMMTSIKHGLKENDMVDITIIHDDNTISTSVDYCLVTSVGYMGDKEDYYYSIMIDNIAGLLSNIKDIRTSKVVRGYKSDYYMRMFKKLNDKTYANNLNKLGFSKTLYNDNVAQIVFTEDIDIDTNVANNLGCYINDIYLTIVKRHKGDVSWYKDKDYCNEEIEFSHCFGKVSSGFDLNELVDDYNIHKIHNVDTTLVKGDKLYESINPSPKHLEEDITIGKEEFAGDIVELNLVTLEETVLEDVYHRFNTVQRELVETGETKEFHDILYTEMLSDDYDVNFKDDTITGETRFSTVQRKYNSYYMNNNEELGQFEYAGNIFPEGYYYKPHYKIILKELSSELKQDSNIRIKYIDASIENGKLYMKCSMNYGFIISEDILFYNEATGEKFVEVVEDADNFTNEVTISMNNIKDLQLTDDQTNSGNTIISGYTIYQCNYAIPQKSYDMKDGTGRCLWRDILSYAELKSTNPTFNDVFTNNAHYKHLNVNFFLQRQDPQGEFNIFNKKVPYHVENLIIQSEKDENPMRTPYVDNTSGTTQENNCIKTISTDKKSSSDIIKGLFNNTPTKKETT